MNKNIHQVITVDQVIMEIIINRKGQIGNRSCGERIIMCCLENISPIAAVKRIA
jgi:hypothetical protein